MPRIRPTVFWHARRRHQAIVRLLPVCRDLSSAENELRWLKEHAHHVSAHRLSGDKDRHILARYVARRASGEPLQYILGSSFFGELEIRCRPGVLIPRSASRLFVDSLIV